MTKPTCKVTGCERIAVKRGWCNAHYNRWWKTGDPGGPFAPYTGPQDCSVPGCEKQALAKSLCPMHYQRRRIYGSVVAVGPHGPHNIRPWQQFVCTVKGCGKPGHTKDYCSMHYWRLKTHGVIEYQKPGEIRDGKKICPRCEENKPLSDYYADDHVYCKPCARARRREYYDRKPEERPKWEHQCRICGATFLGDHKTNTTCSEECRKENNRALDSEARVRRRYRMRVALVDRVVSKLVFDRDDWQCGLCGKPIPKDAKRPDPLSPSVDHIMPLSLGGDHSYANVQATHLVCNLSKGNRI